ncbi:MAG: NAD(P)/FAD-dependent oxidoreductase [Limisphaerales bacterium]
MVTNRLDVVVLGAGIAGLLAARKLGSKGYAVRVIEKARGVGGRMATRRTDHGTFDHGAQYFSIQSPEFREVVDEWQQAGAVKHWSNGFQMQSGEPRSTDLPRYRGAPSMTAGPKLLAQGLDIALQTKATAVRHAEHGWTVDLEDSKPIHARALVITAPVPQGLALLDAGDTRLPEDARQNLKAIHYAPCLALMASLPERSLLPNAGGMWFDQEPLAWMADNTIKGVSAAPGAAVTIHAAPEFSTRHWTTPEEDVTRELLQAASPWLGSTPVATRLHRWRYSHPITSYPDKCLCITTPNPLVFAGDAFGGAKVEGAALSGLTAAEHISRNL